MIKALAHTAFAVADLDRSLAFYGSLGIHEAFRLHHADGSLMLVYLHIAGDQFIEVFPGREFERDRPGSFMHICLQTEDIHAAVERLRAAGIAIDREPAVGLDRNWQAWISDPDGNAIELMQLAEDSPQRRIARGEAPGA